MALTARPPGYFVLSKSLPRDGDAKREKMKTPTGGSGKIIYPDEEIRRWRQLGATMSGTDLHKMLAAEGKSVTLRYVYCVLRGDTRPFA